MKKLMITAAAALCATAAAYAEGVESGIVGYQENTSNSGTGYTMMCPNFLGVGNETGCKLSDLTVTGYATMSAGQFMLKPLTATGTAESGPYY